MGLALADGLSVGLAVELTALSHSIGVGTEVLNSIRPLLLNVAADPLLPPTVILSVIVRVPLESYS